jgi:uncharacterized protein (TIGR03905 family)
MPNYKPIGCCSTAIHFTVDEGILKTLEFEDGCSGNAQGLSKLAVGRPIDELITALKGIRCQNGTSCPDQLAQALEMYRRDRR